MEQGQFEQVFDDLAPQLRKVLLRLLVGEKDSEIAKSLHITESTVRKHIQVICKKFKCEPDEHRAKRPELMALFRKCKPELVKECTLPVTSENKAVETSEEGDSSTVESSEYLSPTIDPNFVGRENAIADLNTLVSQGKKVILIQAEGGVGKTTLAYRYIKARKFDIKIVLPVAKERQDITSVESVIEEWLKRHFDEEPGREFGITLDRLRHKLQDETKKIGILIDNLEPALKNGRFIEEHRRYVELLRVLTEPDVQSVTLITSREPLYENSSICLYKLSELSIESWNQYFEIHDINTGFSPLSNTSALYQMHQAYGGNAEAMFIFSGAIKNDCQGDLEAYWQENCKDLLINPTLENLVKSQFNKLQEDNEQAYRFLCRLGCFRYQDVPSVPKEGIFYLLWDVQEERRKRVVKALRDRSLVKVCNNEYYLHPVIRAEAINRLRESEDWETANCNAANFWTDSVKKFDTIEDVLRAFEAYFHYVEIKYFEKAAEVIIQHKNHDRKSNPENLGSACWKFGLLYQIISIITYISDKISDAYYLSFLNLIIGYAYNLIGAFHQALKCHKESAKLASKYLDLNPQLATAKNEIYWAIRRLQLASIENISVCNIDLLEIEDAIKNIENCLLIAETDFCNFYTYAADACFILAFLKSYLGFREEASSLAEKAYIRLSWSVIHNCWTKGYGLFFLGLTYKNLGEIEKSFEMFREAIAFAEESHYTQVKGKA
jgi:tetratricopeptide (TPR) repeat protein